MSSSTHSALSDKLIAILENSATANKPFEDFKNLVEEAFGYFQRSSLEAETAVQAINRFDSTRKEDKAGILDYDKKLTFILGLLFQTIELKGITPRPTPPSEKSDAERVTGSSAASGVVEAKGDGQASPPPDAWTPIVREARNMLETFQRPSSSEKANSTQPLLPRNNRDLSKELIAILENLATANKNFEHFKNLVEEAFGYFQRSSLEAKTALQAIKKFHSKHKEDKAGILDYDKKLTFILRLLVQTIELKGITPRPTPAAGKSDAERVTESSAASGVVGSKEDGETLPHLDQGINMLQGLKKSSADKEEISLTSPAISASTGRAATKTGHSTERVESHRVEIIKTSSPTNASGDVDPSHAHIPNFFDDVITKIGSAQLQGHDDRIPSHELNVALKLLEKRKSYRVKHVMNPSEASAFRLNAANVYLQEAQAFYSNHSNGQGLFGLYGEVFRKITLLIPLNPFLNLTEKYLPTALNNDNSLHGAFISELHTLIELARKNSAMMEHATDFVNHYHPNNAVLSEKETSLYLVHHHVCKELISTFPTVMADYYFDGNSSLDESIKSSETIASPDSAGSESPEGVIESKGGGDASPIRKHTQSENLSSAQSMRTPPVFLNIPPLDLPRARPLTNEGVRDIGQRKLPPGGVLPPLPQSAFALARLKREIDSSNPATPNQERS
jgi:hypothetical protein